MFNRRDFLKVAALTSAGLMIPELSNFLDRRSRIDKGRPNILILVFDAMSARHLPFHGYPRNTAPNLQKFAQRSLIYHSHFSTGNFTTSGTASLLTGMHPWSHRAINYRGLVKRNLVDRNLFYLVGDEYARMAFTQNMFAEIILSQFGKSIDVHLSPDMFSFYKYPTLQARDFPNDRTLAYFAIEDFLGVGVKSINPVPGSLPLGMSDIIRRVVSAAPEASDDFPNGYPSNHSFFYRNGDVFQGIVDVLVDLNRQSTPWITYFHVWSPHGPYTPQKDYVGLFHDEIDIPSRPRHKLSESKYSPKKLLEFRLQYDEYIANVDAEFGNLVAGLEQAGVLDDTCFIITSDHGELFERGELGHGTPLLYSPVTNVPLLISMPGQKHQIDIHSPTSSVDLVPTILTITGKEIPPWIEGQVLPGFNDKSESERSVYSFVAKNNSAFQDIDQGTISLIKWPYELIYYTGYPRQADSYELYNLVEDQYEDVDLMQRDALVATRMKEELLDVFETTIKPV